MVRGNPSQARTLDPEGTKKTLISWIKEYEKTRNPELGKRIINLMQRCADEDINISREARIFNKVKNKNG